MKRRLFVKRLEMNPELNIHANWVSEILGETGLRTCAGTAGDTGSRTWRAGLTGERCHLLVGAVIRVRMREMFMADHHPAESKGPGQFHSAPSIRLQCTESWSLVLQGHRSGLGPRWTPGETKTSLDCSPRGLVYHPCSGARRCYQTWNWILVTTGNLRLDILLFMAFKGDSVSFHHISMMTCK